MTGFYIIIIIARERGSFIQELEVVANDNNK